MKNFNEFPTSEKKEKTPIEKYQEGYNSILQKIIEDNPELDYLQYDDSLLLAKGSDSPIIDADGNVGKSLYSQFLQQDDLKEKGEELAEKVKMMFDDFFRIYPEVDANQFPRKFDYEKIKKELNIGNKKMGPGVVDAETVYANANLMIEKNLLNKEEAEKIIRYYLKKIDSNK